MVKFERNKTEKSQKAIKALEKQKLIGKNGTCNTPEVNSALQEMFYGKCYICERKGLATMEIEHLIPHRDDLELEYDWNNLFLACRHCNNTKGVKYDSILNCTEEDIDKKIAFRKTGYFGQDEKFVFDVLEQTEKTVNTQKLLEDVFYGSTPQKEMESKVLRRALRKELSKFKNQVREYKDAEEWEKEDLRCLMKRELSVRSEFTAFKRWLIRDNKESFPELNTYIE